MDFNYLLGVSVLRRIFHLLLVTIGAATHLVIMQPAVAQTPPITDVQFSPDAKQVVVISQKGVEVYSWPALKMTKRLKTGMTNLHQLQFSPDGSCLAVGGGTPAESGSVEVFSWPQLEKKFSYSAHDDSVSSLAWNGTSEILSASLDRSVIRWNLGQKKVVAEMEGHSRGVKSVNILPSGEVVTGGLDHSVRVWNLETEQLIRSLNQHSQPIHSVAVKPSDSGLVMVASAAEDRTIRFWQPTIGRMVRYVRLDSVPLDIGWLGPDRLVASCVDGKVRLIDTDNVKVLTTKVAIKEWAYAIAIHPKPGSSGRWIVVGGKNGQLRKLLISVPKRASPLVN